MGGGGGGGGNATTTIDNEVNVDLDVGITNEINFDTTALGNILAEASERGINAQNQTAIVTSYYQAKSNEAIAKAKIKNDNKNSKELAKLEAIQGFNFTNTINKISENAGKGALVFGAVALSAYLYKKRN